MSVQFKSKIPLKYKYKHLLEITRTQLIQKSKLGRNYKDTSKGKNRFERRMKSRIAHTVSAYNKLDFDTLFKRDVIKLGVDVYGETDNYVVTIKLNNLLKRIQDNIKLNNNKIEFSVIYRSVVNCINNDDVYIGCSCKDFLFRFNYYATKNNFNANEPEIRPSNITNPNDDLGSGCKHCMLVLSNISWAMRISSTINNYINYCRKYIPNSYKRIIFPKLFGVDYDKAFNDTISQMSIYDYQDFLPGDEQFINDSNRVGRDSGKFKKKETNNERTY